MSEAFYREPVRDIPVTQDVDVAVAEGRTPRVVAARRIASEMARLGYEQ